MSFKKFVIDFYSEGIASSIINYFHEYNKNDKEQTIQYLLSLNYIIPKIIIEEGFNK